MDTARSPRDLAASLPELWPPRMIAEVDDNYVRVANVHDTFDWPAHTDEDELFVVLDGRFRIEMEHATVVLGPGELFVVPRGVRHNPSADDSRW